MSYKGCLDVLFYKALTTKAEQQSCYLLAVLRISEPYIASQNILSST